MAKTKDGRLLGHGAKLKVTIQHFLPNKKTKKVPLFVEKKLNMAMIQKVHGK